MGVQTHKGWDFIMIYIIKSYKNFIKPPKMYKILCEIINEDIQKKLPLRKEKTQDC